jgi:hypothetical protein
MCVDRLKSGKAGATTPMGERRNGGTYAFAEMVETPVSFLPNLCATCVFVAGGNRDIAKSRLNQPTPNKRVPYELGKRS